MSKTPPEPLKVFVSYTHDSPAHSSRVRVLADGLRDVGFDCDLDQYHVNQDWPAWMERSIAKADFVLVVCTPTYQRRWNNDEKPGAGLGAQWESLLTRQHLYLSPGVNNKFVPVFFEPEHIASIPTPLTNVTRVDLTDADGFDRLRCRLLNIAPAEKPPLRTSLAPFTLAPGFFSSDRGSLGIATCGQASDESAFDHRPFGLADKAETVFSNLFPVSFPSVIQAAEIKVKRTVNFTKRLQTMWEDLGEKGTPPMDFVIDDGKVYRFTPWTEGVWQAMIQRRLIQPVKPKATADWANSTLLANKNRFIMLLNRSLDQLCLTSGMTHNLGWSKEMKCHLFTVKQGTRVGTIKVQAIKTKARREVYKAIPDKTSDDRKAIQHWQHQAFRHFFVRFGDQWFLNIIPFWAFTCDGMGSPSRWQKTSSSNMRKPEKNRAVLGHVMFWASILCKEADLLRPCDGFCLHRPIQLETTPSIDDGQWIKITEDADQQALVADMGILL